jgi:hypothetical protein
MALGPGVRVEYIDEDDDTLHYGTILRAVGVRSWEVRMDGDDDLPWIAGEALREVRE